MNNVSDLHGAVQEWPEEDLSVPDIDVVIRGGRRIRLRRRLYAAATAVVVVAGVVVGLTLISPLGPQPTQPELGTSAPPPDPGPKPDRAVPDSCVRTSAATDLTPPPIGDIIRTGIRDTRTPAAERVFYVACHDRADKKGTELVIITAVQHPDGALEGAESTHGVGLDDEIFATYQGTHYEDGYRSLPMGYYIGPAARIAAAGDDGASVTAQQATWSEDPDLVVFWFDVKYAALPFEGFRVYDADKRLLFAR